MVSIRLKSIIDSLYYYYDGYLQKIVKRRPIFVTFFITAKCNSNCKHCLYWKEINADKKELDLSEIIKISKKMGKFQRLLISGGEPFLRKDIVSICQAFYDNNNIKEINIPTNCSMPNIIRLKTEEILKHCPKSLIRLQLSFDEVGKKHDKIRGLKGSFGKIIKTYKLLSKLKKYKNFEISFCNTFSNKNQNRMNEIYEFIMNELKTNKIFSILVRGKTRAKGIKKISLEKYENMIKINKLMVKNDNVNALFKNMHIISHILLYETVVNIKKNRVSIPCNAANLNCVIDEEGNVFSCELKKYYLGSLRKNNYDFKKLWQNKRRSEIIKKIKNDKCSCTDETFVSNNIRFCLKYYPTLIREGIKTVLSV